MPPKKEAKGTKIKIANASQGLASDYNLLSMSNKFDTANGGFKRNYSEIPNPNLERKDGKVKGYSFAYDRHFEGKAGLRDGTKEEREGFDEEQSFALDETPLETVTVSRRNAAAVQFPNTWTLLEPYETWRQVLVNVWDADYAEAKRLFTLAGERTLLSIYRIQNPSLLQRFLSEKTSMELQYAGRWPKMCGMESRLYHGAGEESVEHIGEKGFDPRATGGMNGMQYGAGAYFSRDMSYWTQQQKSTAASSAADRKFA